MRQQVIRTITSFSSSLQSCHKQQPFKSTAASSQSQPSPPPNMISRERAEVPLVLRPKSTPLQGESEDASGFRELNDALPLLTPNTSSQFFHVSPFSVWRNAEEQAAAKVRPAPQPSQFLRRKFNDSQNRRRPCRSAITTSPVVAAPAGFRQKALSSGRRSRSSPGRGWAQGSG